MYEIDILVNNEWEYYWDNEDIKEIDKAVYKLIITRPNKHIRILEAGNVLCWLNGSEDQYWYWKNKYVRGKGNSFDYTASFYEHQKKKIKNREEV